MKFFFYKILIFIRLINFAGVQDKITLYLGDAHTMLRKIHMQGKKIDLLKVDHFQKPCTNEFLLAEKLKILTDECVVIGTNSNRHQDTEFSYFMNSHPSYITTRYDAISGEVEEKFPKENFWVNREMRDEILVYDPFLSKFWTKMASKCRENAGKN